MNDKELKDYIIRKQEEIINELTFKIKQTELHLAKYKSDLKYSAAKYKTLVKERKELDDKQDKHEREGYLY